MHLVAAATSKHCCCFMHAWLPCMCVCPNLRFSVKLQDIRWSKCSQRSSLNDAGRTGTAWPTCCPAVCMCVLEWARSHFLLCKWRQGGEEEEKVQKVTEGGISPSPFSFFFHPLFLAALTDSWVSRSYYLEKQLGTKHPPLSSTAIIYRCKISLILRGLVGSIINLQRDTTIASCTLGTRRGLL